MESELDDLDTLITGQKILAEESLISRDRIFMWFFNPKYVIFMWSKKAKYVVKKAKYVIPKKPRKVLYSKERWFHLA